MPGLLRGIVRTAAVSATATAVSNRVPRRQAERWSQQESAVYDEPDPSYAPPAAAGCRTGGRSDPPAQELAALREQGILTDEEFAAQKAKILGS